MVRILEKQFFQVGVANVRRNVIAKLSRMVIRKEIAGEYREYLGIAPEYVRVCGPKIERAPVSQVGQYWRIVFGARFIGS
jgi:hypothetical protein